jgi:8-oxo-dGTP diphosphatase
MQATEKNKKNEKVTVVALALKRSLDGKYLLARRGPGQSGAGEWEFPGGKIEAGETQKQALVREIKEELSLDISEQELTLVGDHVEFYLTKTVHIYLWSLRAQTISEIILSEHDSVCWCSPNEMMHLNLSAGDRPFIRLL